MADGLLRRHPEIESLCIADIDPAMVDAVYSWLMLHHTLGASAVLAEVARVLADGGRFLGDDIADTRVARALHRATRSEVRFLTPGVVNAAAGHLVRFDAGGATPDAGRGP